MKRYYTDPELVRIAANCNSYDEILRASVLMSQIARQGDYINLILLNTLAHLQIRKLASL